MMMWFDRAAPEAGRRGCPDSLLNRIRGEYLEMPGLRLTLAQAQRLWNQPGDVCEYVLTRLVDDGFLRRTCDGAFIQCAGG